MEILKVQSTEDKLNYLLGTKAAIRQAIIDQGGEITENTTFRDYVTAIENLNVVDQEVIDEILEALREIQEIEEEQNEQIQEIVTALNRKIEDSDLDGIRADIAANTAKSTANEQAIETLQSQVTTAENEIAELESDKADQTDLDSTNTKVQLAEAAIQSNTNDINAAKIRIETAETNIAQNTTHIATNSAKIANAEREISQNTTNIATNSVNIANIRDNIEDIEDEIEANTAAIIANKGEFDQAVIDINEEVNKRLTTEAAKPLIKRVDYNSTTATFTFEDMEGNEKVVDLPLEATVKSGRYDAQRKVLILVLVSDDEIEIPVSDLVDVYTGIDGAKIKVTVNNQNQIEAQLKTGTVEKSDLTTSLINEIDAKATKSYVDDTIATEDQKIETNKSDITALKGRMTTAEENITTNTTNITNNANAISDLETVVAGKLTMKELGDDLLEAAKATSAGTLVPKIFADLQYSHQYRLMLPYITISNTGAVSYGFQDIVSNSVNDAATNPVTLKFIPDENDDDIYIKVEIDQSKLTEVGKVDTVNNIQPDNNKNVQLDASNINMDDEAETKQTIKDAIVNIKQPLVIDATNIIFLSENSTSEEIFNAFGGKEVIEDIVKNAYIGNTILGRTYAEWGPPNEAFDLDLINIKVSLNYEPYGEFDLDTYPSISIYMSFELDRTRYTIELYFRRNDSNITIYYFGKYIIENVVYLSTYIAGLDKDESTQSEINDALRVSTGDIKTTNYYFATFKFGYYRGDEWFPSHEIGEANNPVLLDARIIRDRLDNLYNYKIIVKFIDNNNNILKKLVFTRSNEESDFVISSQEELDLSQITTNKTAIETLDNKIDGVEDRLQEEIDNIEVPEYSMVEAATTQGYAKTYSLTKDGIETGAKINIPKDLVVKSGEVKVVTVADQPYEGAVVGDKYIDLEINDSAADHIYIPVKDLVDVYTGINGDKINVTINDQNQIEAEIKTGTLELSDFNSTSQGKIDRKVESIFFVTNGQDPRIDYYYNNGNSHDTLMLFKDTGDTKPTTETIGTNKGILFNTNAEEVNFDPSTSGLISTKLAPAIRELKELVDTNTSDISDLQDAIEEAGKVDTVNNIQPDANKNITLDASNINIDETAETKVTVKSAIENIKQPLIIDITKIPLLKKDSTSEEIIEAFGGIEVVENIIKNTYIENTILGKTYGTWGGSGFDLDLCNITSGLSYPPEGTFNINDYNRIDFKLSFVLYGNTKYMIGLSYNRENSSIEIYRIYRYPIEHLVYINENICNLTQESTQEEINAALTASEDIIETTAQQDANFVLGKYSSGNWYKSEDNTNILLYFKIHSTYEPFETGRIRIKFIDTSYKLKEIEFYKTRDDNFEIEKYTVIDLSKITELEEKVKNIKQPIVLDSSILRLTEESTSEEVLEAFGGLENIRKVAKAVINKDTEIIVNDTHRTIAGDFVISAHDNDYIVTDSMMDAQAGADLELPSDIYITLNVTRTENGFEGEVTGLSINCITFYLSDDSVTISSNLKSIIPGIYTISKNIDTLTTTSTPTEILEVIDLIEIDRICHLDTISFCNFEIEDSNRGAPNHVFGKYKFVSLTAYNGYFKFEYLKNQYNDSSNPILKIITIEAHTMYDSDAKVTNIEELNLSQITTNKTAIETLDNKIDGVEDRLQGEIDNIEVPEYTIEEQAQAETGYSKTYYLTKDGTQVGSKINIPKDLVIKSGEVKTVTTANVPYEGAQVGDKYIDITLNDVNEEHIYIPVKDLVDAYTGVNGSKINVTINSQNQIEAKIKAGTIQKTDLASNLVGIVDHIEASRILNNLIASNNNTLELQGFNSNIMGTYKYIKFKSEDNSNNITINESTVGSNKIIEINQIVDSENVDFDSSTSGLTSTKLAPAIRELKGLVDNAGAVNTVNNVTADQNKNVQLDASNINLDDTAATPETLKSIIEAQATKITTLEGKVAELEAALGDIRTALELLNGVEDANNEEF